MYKFRVTSFIDKKLEVSEGRFEDSPPVGTQKVEVLHDDGTVLVLSGFDRYWLYWPLLGGVQDEDRPGELPAQTWRLTPGRALLTTTERYVPVGAVELVGTLAPDDIAREIGLRF